MKEWNEPELLLKELSKNKTTSFIILSLGNDFETNENLFHRTSEYLSTFKIPLETTTLNGPEAEDAALHSEVATIPMFESMRLIRLKHADSFLKKISKNKTVFAYYQRDLRNMPPGTSLILETDENKIPADWHFLREGGLILTPRKIREQDLPAFIKERANRAGFEIDIKTASLLVQRCAFVKEKCLNALDRLMLYTLSEKSIHADDIDEVVTDEVGDVYFKILDSFAKRQPSLLKLVIQHDFSDAGEIVNRLAKWVSDAIRFRHLSDSGMSVKDAHKRLGLNTQHQYVFRMNNERFQTFHRVYSRNEQTELLRNLLTLDERLKMTNSAALHHALVTAFFSTVLHGQSRNVEGVR